MRKNERSMGETMYHHHHHHCDHYLPPFPLPASPFPLPPTNPYPIPRIVNHVAWADNVVLARDVAKARETLIVWVERVDLAGLANEVGVGVARGR